MCWCLRILRTANVTIQFYPWRGLTLGLPGFKKTRFDFLNWCKEQLGVWCSWLPALRNINQMHLQPTCLLFSLMFCGLRDEKSLEIRTKWRTQFKKWNPRINMYCGRINIGDKLLFNYFVQMWNCHDAFRTCTSQCQDGIEVLKCHEWRGQGIIKRFKNKKHTKKHINACSRRL